MKRTESVGRLSAQIHRISRSYINKRMSDYGIGSGQFHFLMRLYRHDGLCLKELVSALHLDKGTATRAVHKLEANGFVVSRENIHDRRSRNVYLTEKARKLKPDIESIFSDWNEILLRGFHSEEKTALYDYLERVIENGTENQ